VNNRNSYVDVKTTYTIRAPGYLRRKRDAGRGILGGKRIVLLTYSRKGRGEIAKGGGKRFCPHGIPRSRSRVIHWGQEKGRGGGGESDRGGQL